MDMKLRKIIRDFVNWQGKNDMLKNELTIDYEVAETYLEQTNLIIFGVVRQSEQLKDKETLTFEEFLNNHKVNQDDETYGYKRGKCIFSKSHMKKIYDGLKSNL